MNRHSRLVQRHLIEAWDAVRLGLRTMYPVSDVRPNSGFEVFVLSDNGGEDETKFDVNPIIFNVPERATRQDPNLFIALKGWLSFEAPGSDTDSLRTKSFGTEIGYFRSKHDVLEHVYGAHYEIDEHKPGHPVFHAQISPQMGLLAHVNDHFRRSWAAEDRVRYILRNIRTPCAQMDVFSVIAQICADHLIHNESGPEVHRAFSRMRASCDFFVGAAHRMEYLSSAAARNCYRSTHWYAGTP